MERGRHLGRYLALGLLGAALATALDLQHVRHRVLAYPHPVFLGRQAWWVPLLFAISTLALLNQARWFRRPTDAGSLRWMIPRVLDFAAAYLLTAFARDTPWPLTAVLVATWVPWVWGQPRQWVFGLSVAIVGPLVEASLCHFGAFFYLPDQPLFCGIPVWLPALYLHVSVGVRALELAVFPVDPRPSAASESQGK